VQAIALLTDVIIISALIAVVVYIHWAVALIALYATHQSMRSTGGWFFAWKKENREAFTRNWNELNDCA
jgi:ABC-type bacteriocin/lantibiotic exporter with double-glycine peptidase domain